MLFSVKKVIFEILSEVSVAQHLLWIRWRKN